MILEHMILGESKNYYISGLSMSMMTLISYN